MSERGGALATHQELVGFVWSDADLLREAYRRIRAEHDEEVAG